MQKLILSTCLVAGTAVGAGMIALPMALCKIGIVPTLVLILVIWFLMYLSSLIGVEINLKAGHGLPLGKLGSFYSGKVSSFLGSTSLILLIYALLCAYLHGGASILQAFLKTYTNSTFELKSIIVIYAFLLGSLFALPIGSILQINRGLLTVLLSLFGVLAVGLVCKMELSHLPLLENSLSALTSWTEAIPLLSTSFGFQVVLHTLTNFCERDPVLLKRSIFWGSLIPAAIYILWTVSTLGVLYHYDLPSYQKLLKGQLEVGEFIQTLAKISAWTSIQMLVSIISIIAILKSSIGVGLALLEAWQEQLRDALKNKSLSLFLTVFPPLIIALFVPQLFLKALRFGGMISIIIAVLLPLWLINRPKAQERRIFYPCTASRLTHMICLTFALIVILCEVINMLSQ
jgi:tyrosine-specific transport protein